MPVKNNLKKYVRTAMCVLLAVSLITGCLSAEGFAVSASGAERTFDIGINENSVTAVLSADGVLSVSGSGEIKDFTGETAPFAGLGVKELTIGADVKSIGDYTFYNCGDITNEIVLPKNITRIGDRAFSGDSADSAAKPAYVENLFTSATVTRKQSVTAAATATPTPVPTVEPTATPAPTETPMPESEAADDNSDEENAEQGDELSAQVMTADEIAVNAAAPDDEVTSQAEATEQPQTGEVSAEPAATATPSATTKYTVETVTEQEIGEEIFYPRDDTAVFISASEQNQAFAAAMLSAGYVQAEGTVTVALDCGEGSADPSAIDKTLPIVGGSIILPSVPSEFTAPDGGELFAYSFGGWTEAEDSAGVVRAAGSKYEIGDKTDLYFIASWKRETLAKISVRRDGGDLVMQVPTVNGYDFTEYKWQSCLLSVGSVVPSNQEQLAWKDIDGANTEIYRCAVQKESGTRLFRCVVTAERTKNLLASLLSSESAEQISLAAVSGEDAITKITLKASTSAAGGQQAVEQKVTLPVSETGTVYKITDVTVSGDCNLVLPSESGATVTLPRLADGQSVNDTYALRAVPTGDGWTSASLSEGGYVLSALPTGKTEWNSGVSGLWKRGSGNAVTNADVAEVAISLIYESSYENFVGGQAELVFQEYAADDIGGTSKNTTVVRVTLDGEQTGTSQSAAVAAGRHFSEELTAKTATITPQNAVTAFFTTEYTPTVTGTNGSRLALHKSDGTDAALPVGTKIIMADMTTAGAYKYYFYTTADGDEGVELGKFSGYAGAATADERIKQKLLFTLDFSAITGTALAAGDYYLTLEHQTDETTSWARAAFTVADSTGSWVAAEGVVTDGAVWQLNVTANADGNDTRFSGGANVHLTFKDSDGNAVALPEKAIVKADSGDFLRSKDGTVTLVLPIGETATVTLDFTETDDEDMSRGEYSVNMIMRPQAGLQTGGGSGYYASTTVSGLTLARSAVDSAQRSISVSVADDCERLLDAEEQAAQLRLVLLYKGIQPGDTLSVEILEKTGSAPTDSSYTAIDTAGWQISPESGHELTAETEELTITVPQGCTQGTYRVKLTISSSGGGVAADEVYNFIVK